MQGSESNCCSDEEIIMRRTTQTSALLLLLVWGCNRAAGANHATAANQASIPLLRQRSTTETIPLDAAREKHALQIFLTSVRASIVSAASAMPADKYGFAPADGEFKGVRTFGQQVKHLAATNHILAAAALGEEAPADAGDETGPEAIRTKSEILDYLTGSFVHLGKAVDAIGDRNMGVRSSPISPLQGNNATRLGLTVEALIHAFDHYGQMVEYLRMNGVVPPASRP
jgi:uncharacterized damage-inducible protein DinB